MHQIRIAKDSLQLQQAAADSGLVDEAALLRQSIDRGLRDSGSVHSLSEASDDRCRSSRFRSMCSSSAVVVGPPRLRQLLITAQNTAPVD